MGNVLQRVADIIIEAAGWHNIEPKDGVFHFEIGELPSIDLFSPDMRTAILRSEIAPLPSSEIEAIDEIKRMAKIVVGAIKSRSSILSLENGKFYLHKKFLINEQSIFIPPSPIPQLMADFMNDLEWWLIQSNNDQIKQVSSPFSMHGFDSFLHMN